MEANEKIIYLTVDALRYDVIEEDIVETPNIDRIRSKGLDFERAFSNGFGTPYVFPALLYGSSENEEGKAPNSKSIADYFGEKEFETIGITSNPYTSSYYGYSQGFDDFTDYVTPTVEKEKKNPVFRLGRKVVKKFDFLYDKITSFTTKHSLPYERAETINQEILERISDGKQFIWAHYMEPHAPYSPPKKYRDRCPEAWDRRGKLTNKLYSGEISDQESEMLWQLYLAEVKYLDDQIGKLLEELDQELEDYTLIFTSDHGEEFGDRGEHLHSQFFEANIHIPLTFYTKNEDISETRTDIATQLDILPTIASIYDIETDTDGINLLEETRQRFEIKHEDSRIVITDDWKLIDRPGEKYLFDIYTNLEEGENLYEQEKDVVEDLDTGNKNSS